MKRFIEWMLVFTLVIGLIGCSATNNMATSALQQLNSSNTAAEDNHSTDTPQQTSDSISTQAEPLSEPVETKGEEYEVVYQKGTVYHDSIGMTWVQVVVQIENTGSVPLYLKSSSADLENSEGKLVKTMPLLSIYPTVLQPDETALLVEQTMLDDDPGVEELNVIPHLEIAKAKVECIRYNVSDLSLENEQYGSIKMLGRVENNTDKVESMVYVVANLYDTNHKGIGQLFTILTNDLKPGEKIGFTLSCLSAPDSLTVESVASYEVFAFPLQYQF